MQGPIEAGRFSNVQKFNRKFLLLKNLIEDEFHFKLQCTVYSSLRKRFIKPYFFWGKPGFELIHFFERHV